MPISGSGDSQLHINDRVRRIGTQRTGVVVEVYTTSASNVPGTYPRHQYAVQWHDTGLVERGYMDGGLVLEPQTVGIYRVPDDVRRH